MEDDDEVEELQRDLDYVDDIEGKGQGEGRVAEVEARHGGRTGTENKYERKLDYRCEGRKI